MAEKPLLVYWNFQGIANGIRNLLRHLGVEFEEKNYKFGNETLGNVGGMLSQRLTCISQISHTGRMEIYIIVKLLLSFAPFAENTSQNI